jgi:hypothetical protein
LDHPFNCDVVCDHHAFGRFLHYDVHDHLTFGHLHNRDVHDRFALNPLPNHDVVHDSPILGPHFDCDVHVCLVLRPLIINCDVVCDGLALGLLINYDYFILNLILDRNVVHNRLALSFFIKSMDDLLVHLKEVICPNEPKLKVDCVILHHFLCNCKHHPIKEFYN